MKKHLCKKDKAIITDFQGKHIGTKSLETIFSHINDNHRFASQEKDYLKRILTENINNAYKREHTA